MSEYDCETCEDEGVVCVNFGLDAPGRPRIDPCPDCGAQEDDEPSV